MTAPTNEPTASLPAEGWVMVLERELLQDANGCNHSAELHPDKAAYYHGKRKGYQEAVNSLRRLASAPPAPAGLVGRADELRLARALMAEVEAINDDAPEGEMITPLYDREAERLARAVLAVVSLPPKDQIARLIREKHASYGDHLAGGTDNADEVADAILALRSNPVAPSAGKA